MTRSATTGAGSGSNAVPDEPLTPALGTTTPPVGIVDLFAGIGCVADGFAAQGLEPRALLDVDADARRTYLHNFPDANYLLCDVSQLTLAHVGEIVGDGVVAGVVGCPPCQGFSAAGARKGDDPRNALLGAFFAAVDLFAPLFFALQDARPARALPLIA